MLSKEQAKELCLSMHACWSSFWGSRGEVMSAVLRMERTGISPQPEAFDDFGQAWAFLSLGLPVINMIQEQKVSFFPSWACWKSWWTSLHKSIVNYTELWQGVTTCSDTRPSPSGTPYRLSDLTQWLNLKLQEPFIAFVRNCLQLCYFYSFERSEGLVRHG